MADIEVRWKDGSYQVTCSGMTVKCDSLESVYAHLERITRYRPDLTEEWVGEFPLEDEE